MAVVTVAAPFVQQLLQGYRTQRDDVEQLLRECKITPQVLHNNQIRVPAENFAKISKAIRTRLNNESYGLSVKPIPTGAFRLMAIACLNSQTVGESFQVCVDFYNLLSIDVQMDFYVDDQKAALCVQRRPNCRFLNTYALESLLSAIHRFHCWLSGEFLPIQKVELDYPSPAHQQEYRFVFYRAPVQFGENCNTLYFDRDIVNFRCIRDRQALQRFLDNYDANILALTRRSSSLAYRLRQWLEKEIREKHRMPTLQTAASYFHMQPQTLGRRLLKEQTSYQTLKDETRRDMAIHMINFSEFSIDDIAINLGFSEASTFIRAFKVWTDTTPLAYRRL